MTWRTYGSLSFVEDGWEIDKVPPHVAIRLKNLFPRIPKVSTPPYRLQHTAAMAADLDWFMRRYPMEISEEDRRTLRRGRHAFEDAQAERERILMPDYRVPVYVGMANGHELRHYQSQAVEVLKSRQGLLVGDEVGLGKTITTCGACLIEGALPAHIVVEPHLQKQWRDRIEEFTSLTVHEIKKIIPYDLPTADVYLWRYSNLSGWIDVLRELPVGLAAWDEIQSLRKGTASAKGAASRVLARRAAYRLGLTATPIYNYGVEIWHVMQFIDEEVLGLIGDFYQEWGARISDPEALGSYLREQHVFLRRTRREVGRELPPVNKIIDVVDYDAKVVKEAEDLARQLAIKATTASFVERGQAARELDALARHVTGVSKAGRVADYVRILLESGEPVVLIGWHRDVYEIWLERLADFNPVMYTGSETARQKNEAERRFVEGETSLFIGSLRSGAGLDSLQHRSEVIVFGELDWSPGIHHQWIGRLGRDRTDGKMNNVMAIYLVTEEGSDPPMMEVLGLKASEARAIVDPGLGVQATHSDQSRLEMLVNRYLRKKG